MSNILLVEPNYKNKYPPIGLMKIATYHLNKGDYVKFYKGKAPYIKLSKIDRVYITTLFTFYYEITIDTIKYYERYIHKDNIFIGGIASTLLYSNFKNDIKTNNIIRGQLNDTSKIGYSDKVNIDCLPLDYDILDDILYKYPAGDNFFAYTTRGCPRRCSFCAVCTLEPEFKYTNNIITQINSIRNKYGDKRNLLIMDNNILYSSKLKTIINDLNSLGFINNSPNYIHPLFTDILINKIRRRREFQLDTLKQENELGILLNLFSRRIINKTPLDKYKLIIDEINKGNDIFSATLKYKNELEQIIEKYRYKKKLQRFVDFNQGVDARLLDENNMKILSKIPIKPFRLAYDDINKTNIYRKAFELSYKYGIRYFSNYMLYNYNDTPLDLWERLHNTIELYESKSNIQGFSFPMKYAPINETDRKFIGKNWNKKYLSTLNVILNVTKGVVAKEKDFFYKAFGKNKDEFLNILTMPDDFIKHRLFFENKGYINLWKTKYNNLLEIEKVELLNCLNKKVNNIYKSEKVLDILKLYKITKNSLLKNNDNFGHDENNLNEYVSVVNN